MKFDMQKQAWGQSIIKKQGIFVKIIQWCKRLILSAELLEKKYLFIFCALSDIRYDIKYREAGEEISPHFLGIVGQQW